MNSRFDRWVFKLYPRAWRQRYEDEVRDLSEELLAAGEVRNLRLVIGLVGMGLAVRVRSLRQWHPFVLVSGSVAIAVAVGVILVATNALGPGGSPSLAAPTFGTIPSAKGGHLDVKAIPDYVATLGRNGQVVGYVPRGDLFPASKSSAVGGVIPVYGKDLKTLVGHMYPGVGFVSLGMAPTAEPCVPVTTVDNGTSQSVACPSTTVSVPNVAGSSTPAAAAEISGMSLGVQVISVHSTVVPSGHIVSVSPSAGTVVSARSVITLENSLGSDNG